MFDSPKSNQNEAIINQKSKLLDEYYRYIFNNADDLITVFDEKIEIELINESALKRLLGYNFEDIKGNKSFKIVHPDDLQKALNNFEKAFKEGQSFGESRVKCKDGTYKWLQSRGKIFEKDGEKKLILITRDITRETEEEKKFKLILENTNDLITIINENLIHEYINEAIYRNLLGYSKEDIIGKTPLIPIHPDDQDRAKKALMDGFRIGEGKNEMRIRHKDGHYLWFENKGKTFTDSDGKLKALIISRDINDRKIIESKLREQNVELEKLNELKSEFLRRATHELKTPLVTIKGYTDLLIRACDKNDDSEIIDSLQNILRGCNRLEHTIRNILESSRLNSSKIKLVKKKENLIQLINSCIEEQKELINARNHTIELNLPENLFINIDREQIYEVITNILRNAIIYTPSRGIINIQSEVKNGFIVTSIKDTGFGFTKPEKKQIFQQFGKINRSDLDLELEIEGSGLGLFISKQIIEAHNGQIWMESEGRNMGSTFYFSLPKK